MAMRPLAPPVQYQSCTHQVITGKHTVLSTMHQLAMERPHIVFPSTCSALMDTRAQLHMMQTCGSHFRRQCMKNPRYLRVSTGLTM
jgi:hypothetical protein